MSFCAAADRLGQIYVDGLIGNASIVASGAGSIYVVGLEDTAVVNLAGSASATIKATNSECRSLLNVL